MQIIDHDCGNGQVAFSSAKCTVIAALRPRSLAFDEIPPDLFGMTPDQMKRAYHRAVERLMEQENAGVQEPEEIIAERRLDIYEQLLLLIRQRGAARELHAMRHVIIPSEQEAKRLQRQFNDENEIRREQKRVAAWLQQYSER